MRRPLLALPIALALAAIACAPLQTLEASDCGNGVVEAGEDCEPFEGSEFACRPPNDAMECTIVCDAGGECPTGYGCGIGDVCRKGTGTFESLPFAQAGSKADMLLAGDFDADRRRDVVAVEPGRARIYFADASGNLDQTTVTSPLPPTIGKMGALSDAPGSAALDTTDDLVLPLNIGIGALLSEGNRSFKSKAYGSIPLDTIVFEIAGGVDVTLDVLSAVPVGIDGIPSAFAPNSGDETVVLLELRYGDPGTGAAVDVTLLSVFGTTDEDGMLFPLDETRLENLSGPPVAANFDQDPCEEIAFPKAGWHHLRVYKVCTPLLTPGAYAWARHDKERDALLADIDVGGKITGPAFARDVNGDGWMDLAVPAAAGDSRTLRVAYGTGTGKFHSSPPPLSGQEPDGKAGRYADLLNGSPLELAHLDGDGLIDLVDTLGIARGSLLAPAAGVTEPGFLPWYTAQRPWTDAVVTDINGDGRPDVLASSDGATDIDVLLGTPAGFWNASQISTDGTVSQLVTGDFDGDLVGDILFDDVLSTAETLILISYGRTSGGPEEASEVASFGSVERLVAGNVHTFGADSITDLGAVSTTDGARAFSFFPGTATRLLQAPLVLSDVQQTTHVPLANASGFLSLTSGIPQSEARRDLVVLAATTEPEASVEAGDPLAPYKVLAATLGVWGLYGGEGEADFDRLDASLCAMPGGFFFPRLNAAHSIAVASSGPDEGGLVVAATPFITFTGTAAHEVEISSILAAVSFDDPAQCWSSDAQLVSNAGELFYRVRTADLNTNGIPDILAVKKTYDPAELKSFLDAAVSDLVMTPDSPAPMGPTPLKVLRSELVVLWDASFDKSYSLPEESWDVRDFTVGEIDGDGDPDLLVLDGSRLRRFEGHNGSQELTAEMDITNLPLPAAGAQAVLLADGDGDGIQDIAVRGESLQIFRGEGAR